MEWDDQTCQNMTLTSEFSSSPPVLPSLRGNWSCWAHIDSAEPTPPCWKHSFYWSYSVSVTINSLPISLNWMVLLRLHGYQIKKREKHLLCHFLRASFSPVVPLLSLLILHLFPIFFTHLPVYVSWIPAERRVSAEQITSSCNLFSISFIRFICLLDVVPLSPLLIPIMHSVYFIKKMFNSEREAVSL